MPLSKKAAALTGDPAIMLSDKQKAFVEGILAGMPQTTAARAAGYAFPGEEAVRLMRNPVIKQSVQHLHNKHEKASQMNRKKVMDGLLEAIEMAKMQSDAGVMVAGWREVGRMCGYYAAEKKIIDVNITAKRAIDKLETLTDSQLLEMIEESEDEIEGEFTELLEPTQNPLQTPQLAQQNPQQNQE